MVKHQLIGDPNQFLIAQQDLQDRPRSLQFHSRLRHNIGQCRNRQASLLEGSFDCAASLLLVFT